MVTIPKPKQQKKPIVGLQQTTGTFGGKPGEPVGDKSFFEAGINERPKEVSITQSGLVQPKTGADSIADVSQLNTIQQGDLGFQVPLTPEQVNAEVERLRSKKQLSPITSDLTQVPRQGDSLPLTNIENMSKGVPFDVNRANIQTEQPTGLNKLFQTSAEAANLGRPINEQGQVINTPAEQLQTQIGLGLALGSAGVGDLAVGGGFGLSFAKAKGNAFRELNTQSEARYYVNRFIEKVGKPSGRVTGIGQQQANAKSSNLIKRVVTSEWFKLPAALGGIQLALEFFDDPSSNRKLQPTFDKINNELVRMDALAASEQSPLLQEAYKREAERLAELLDQISNQRGWDALALKLPFTKGWKVDNIIANSREQLRTHRRNILEIDKSRGAINREVLNFINTLSPEEQRAFIEYEEQRKKLQSISKLAVQLPGIEQIEGGINENE